MRFAIKIEPEAISDIQASIDWYNERISRLGEKFYFEVNSYFDKLKTNPYYQTRYDEVRCLPLRKFPFMIHFTIDEKQKLVIVRAVLHTSLNPKHWSRKSY